MTYRFCLILLLGLSFIPPGISQLVTGDDIAIAHTASGDVRGYLSNEIYTYKGIPYAAAERFDAPGKVEPWEGIRSSMSWGPVAPLETPQTPISDELSFLFDHDLGSTGEDCLVLNVWTPGLSDGKRRPVMFWIHGGGYVTGSSQELPSYHGENLSKRGDVVVVSINHRLNILGFLDLSKYSTDHKHSANHGLLDILMALEWVRDNISNFGGDPNNVTIFGQSGGGAKVNNLLAMPSAKGLFHKAIIQSGSFKNAILTKELSQEITDTVLRELDINSNQIDNLRATPYYSLEKAGRKALAAVEKKLKESGHEVPGFGFGLDWLPCLDGDLLPYDIFSENALGLSRDIPLLIGTVKNEFPVSAFTGMSDADEEQVVSFVQQQRGDQTERYIQAVKNAYPDIKRASDLMDVDLTFRPGAVYQSNVKSSLEGAAPLYMYFFSWQSPVMGGKFKAFHCMELPFVFDNITRCINMTGGGPEAQRLADIMSQSWVNFARYGDPGHHKLPQWPAYNKENGATMNFSERCDLWHHHDLELLDIINSSQ